VYFVTDMHARCWSECYSTVRILCRWHQLNVGVVDTGGRHDVEHWTWREAHHRWCSQQSVSRIRQHKRRSVELSIPGSWTESALWTQQHTRLGAYYRPTTVPSWSRPKCTHLQYYAYKFIHSFTILRDCLQVLLFFAIATSAYLCAFCASS